MALELQLLGPFVIIRDGRPLDNFRSSKSQALLAYLVTEAAFEPQGRASAQGREQLMTLLWPRTPQKSAQVNLRQTLYQLRKAIPEVAGPDGDLVPFILSDRKQLEVNPGASYELDVARFLHLLGREPGFEEMAEAVALYRGPFLADFHLPDSETFEEWAAGRRAALERMALEALEALAEHHLDEGETEEAERYARRQFEIDELRESGHRQLMRTLAQQGKRNAAVIHYEAYCQMLEEELGIGPSAEMETLYEAIRAREEADFRREKEVAPPVAAVSPRPEPASMRRLPEPATRFIDRRELMAVTAQLQDGCRLLTLLGPGGSGKTRLSIEAAKALAGRYRHGAAFAELAPLSEPAAIPTAVATAVGFRFSGGMSPREQVLNYLANKELLLVLDNVEHLLGPHLGETQSLAGHPLDGAGQVGALLEAAPAVSVIATSRARLNLGPECLFEVGGLSLPEEGDNFEDAEAVRLFMEHARRARPGLEVDEAEQAAIRRICRLVEGIPLALELAASWARILPPEEIARELAADLDFLGSERADLPDRQRSMRAAFDYSWNLLDEGEQAALMQLSVFRGGASRRAARAVTGASLRKLAALADHSLLNFDPDSGRFAIHELIRQFALELLEKAGDTVAIRDAHCEYYLRALAGRLPGLKGADQLGALDAIEGDFENVRTGWRWAVRRGQWQQLVEASESLFLFALFRSRHLDGVELFEAIREALTSPTTAVERSARAYALAGGQALLSWHGSRKEALAAVPALQEAMQAVDDPAAVAYCQLMLGLVLNHETEWGVASPGALAALEAARDFYRRAEEPFYRAMVLSRLGYAHAHAMRQEEAVDVQRRALALAREAEDRFGAAVLLHNLASATWAAEGLTGSVESDYREATELYREIGTQNFYAPTLAHLALTIIWREGDLEKSEGLLEEAFAVATEQNNPKVRNVALNYLATQRLLEGEYGQVLALTDEALALAGKNSWEWGYATFQKGVAFLASDSIDDGVVFLRRAMSWVMNVVQPSWVRTFLAYCATLVARQGEPERAAELLALGMGDPFHRGGLETDPLLARTRAELEKALGEETFAAAWERGKARDPLAVAPKVLEMLEAWEAADA